MAGRMYTTYDEFKDDQTQAQADPLTPSYQTPTASQPAPAGDSFFEAPAVDTQTEGRRALDAPSYASPEALAPNNAAAWASTTQGGAAPAANPYDGLLSQITQATDPTQKAVLQDQLARQMYADLKTAGHDVKWQGDQLIVDGRPYVIGGQQMGNQYVNPTVPSGTPTQDPSRMTSTQAPAGYDAEKWANEAHQTPKYMVGRLQSQYNMQDPAERDAFIAALMQLEPGTQFNGKDKIMLPGTGEGRGVWIDIFGNASGGEYRTQWLDTSYEPGGANYQAPATATGVQAPGAAGVATGFSGGPQAPQTPWSLSGPSYAPGAIDTLEGFDPMAGEGALDDATRNAIMGLFEDGAIDQQTEAALKALLTNPHSLDDRTIEMLKAKSREELAALGAQDDEALRTFGFGAGLDDSAWLASERMAGRRGRDESIVRSNRDIDLEAAQTRKADERTAIEMGASYANQKAGRKQAATAAAQSFMAMKSDNAFRTAALQGDRLALRESVNQKAAELGLDADELQLRYTLGLLDDATRRYGINIGASIDREKLAQAGREFQEELAFKFAQLEQMDAQFGAAYGLDVARFQADEDQRAIDNQRTVYGF